MEGKIKFHILGVPPSSSDNSPVIMCTNCHTLSDEYLVWDDYITYGRTMLQCQDCLTYSVLDISITDEKGRCLKDENIVKGLKYFGDHIKLKEKYPKLHTQYQSAYDNNEWCSEKYKYYYVDCLLIKQVVDRQHFMYTKLRPLSQDEIRKFYNDMDGRMYDRPLPKDYDYTAMGIVNNTDSDGYIYSQWRSDDKYASKMEEDVFDKMLALDCNSYDPAYPEKAYPNNFDLAHDGVVITCKCEDIYGNIVILEYWGD